MTPDEIRAKLTECESANPARRCEIERELLAALPGLLAELPEWVDTNERTVKLDREQTEHLRQRLASVSPECKPAMGFDEWLQCNRDHLPGLTVTESMRLAFEGGCGLTAWTMRPESEQARAEREQTKAGIALLTAGLRKEADLLAEIERLRNSLDLANRKE